MRPLTALRLVAGYGIGKLYLKGVVVYVFLHSLQAVSLAWQVLIVLHHVVVELFLLLRSERRSIALQSVENCRHVKLHIVVVRKLQGEVGKGEAIELAHPAHPAHHSHIAIGYEGKRRILLVVKIMILDYHDAVARAEGLIMSQHLSAYSVIIYVGSLVATGDYYGVIHPLAGIALLQTLHYLIAWQRDDVVKP